MKTCRTFSRIKAGYETEMGQMSNHSVRHAGTRTGKSSAGFAAGAKQRMARALTQHYAHCPECG
ncbi:hypothetical protein ACIQV2_15560 [Streptomyces globosus]|uniref:Uncharacterized protein n=1 Tax=Streptomyces flavotricini TaxID=66888 RepID=A0ABS8E0Q6_9ACTN|nr:hypothetical protein [Streptomyces flavotricini]MCC0094651.1 hypothetical protein [Streptomyces flavotricini]MCF3178752.1 hypothetical protein [Streptomyces polychromogenes]GLV88699.1 hypothetical protein Slala04_01530 [Streptomyces lavendulae subsp. lavendulae]